ncbi:MAG: TonB-dependent receptor [Acidobacteria bacterium]|nr:TonB-dependent receptor [Acidobacteriota bacterium]
MSTRSWMAAALATSFIAVSTPAIAQVDRASLTGTIKDASQAVMPGVTVTLKHVATNAVTTLVTDSEGTYLGQGLLPGDYEVRAELTGFQPRTQALPLQVGQRARVDFTLSPGGVTQEITVQGTSPLINTESPIVGKVVNQVEVSKLPLAIRNWDDLLALVPGVQGDRYTEESGSTAAGRTGGVSVHGNRSLQNNFLLDGVDNNSISTNVQELSTQVSRPSVDAINEFRVVTSAFGAEYGRAPGAAISVTTKSGSNRFRGTAYDYYRNDRFDGYPFFIERARQTNPTVDKPKNDQNQFGGNLGGPIVKDRAFFFGDFEGTRISRGVTRLTRVPTVNERSGVFAGAIRDPLTGQPFPGNTIPANRLDPVAAAILNLIPMPNTPGTNNFLRTPSVQDDGERFLGRMDVRLGGADNMFARYIYSDRFRFVPGNFGGLLDGTSTSAWGRNYLKSHALVGGLTKVFGSAVFNETRVSWARGISDGTQDPFGQSGTSQIGFRGVPDDPVTAGGIVGIDIGGGYSRLGSPNFMPKFQHTDQVQITNTLSWLRGRHQWKFGADLMPIMNNEYVDIPSTRGNLQFSGGFTQVFDGTTPVANTGSALADFMLGYVFDAELSNVHRVNQRRWSTSFYAQDDWRPSDDLTLTLGLRYDFMTPSLEADNRQANFDPARGTLVSASDGSLEDRALVKPDTNNFAPRLGLVYRLTDTTVLRSGYGIFYNLLDRIGSEDQLALNPPGLRNIRIRSSSAVDPVFFLRDGFPAGYLDPNNIVLGRLTLRTSDRNAPAALYHHYSGGIEKQFGASYVASIDVIGTRGSNLAILRNLNQPLPGTRDANGARPYPTLGHIQYREHSGESEYLGADFSFERRFARGYGFRMSYTLGESRDQAPEHLAASSGRPQNGRDLSSWEGPSDFDVRHRFVGSFVVELPFGAGKPWLSTGPGAALLGGWTLSGIYTGRSGLPFTVTQGTNNVGDGATGLPNLVGDPEGARTVDSWFNVAGFELVPSGTFGNAGRNILRGPRYASFDTSLQRRFGLIGDSAAVLRWDVFNVFNRPNFGLPNRSIPGSTAGTITSLAGDARLMQFAVRIEF